MALQRICLINISIFSKRRSVGMFFHNNQNSNSPYFDKVIRLNLLDKLLDKLDKLLDKLLDQLLGSTY